MKGKNLLLHHYRRAFAIAAIALASVGATQAQNLITPNTQPVVGTAFKTTTDVDWDNQTLEADIDLSTLNNSDAAGIFNVGTVDNTQDTWQDQITSDAVILHFYYKPSNKNFTIWLLHKTTSDRCIDITYDSSNHGGNTIHISMSKDAGMTLTDANGDTVSTISASTLSEILGMTNIEVSVNKDPNNAKAHATYNYIRLKGLTTSTNSFGMKAIKGWTATASDVNSLLTEEKGKYTTTAYDLSALDVEDGVTVNNPSNTNAIIMTTGTVAEDGTATATKWTDMPNLVVASDGNLYAAKTINLIDDNNYYPVYTGHAITTTEQSGGFTYKRDVKISTNYGYKWISMCLPMDLTTIPDGVTVWAYNADKSKGTETVFNNTTQPMAHTPYFAQATKDVTISASATGVLDMTSAKSISNNASVPLTFHGNYGVIAGDGTQYALQNSMSFYDTKMPTYIRFDKGSTIDAFRAYLTLGSTEIEADDLASYTLSFEGDATAIRNISTEKTGKEASIYTIDGRCTGATSLQTLPHGLYIQGGKKVVVK